MQQVTRYVFLCYAAGFILAAVIYRKCLQWLWDSFDVLQDYAIAGDQITLTLVIAVALAVGTTFWAYRKREYYEYLSEIILELEKVTWPQMSDVKRATLVVIAFTFILSAYLAGTDWIWKSLSSLIFDASAS